MSPAKLLPAQGEPHWAAAARGELQVPHCRACEHVWYPPASFCPNCHSDDIEWRVLSGRGRVTAWTRFHRAYFPHMPPPYGVILVQLDEGPQLYANFADPDATPVIGQAVQAVFVPVGPDEAIVRFKPTEISS